DERAAAPAPGVGGVVAHDELEETAAVRLRRRLDRLDRATAGQLGAQDLVVAPAATVELVQPCQGAEREQDGIHVRPILEAEADVIGGEGALRLAVLEPAVVPEHEHPIEEERVVGHGDPRLAAADSLHALQAEAADVSPRTDRAPAIAGAVRVRAVL